ncbi:MAG: endolytic transglycosylase MltG [Gammaproteobacteria bacterium]
MRRVILSLAGLIVVLLAAGALWINDFLDQPLAIPPDGYVLDVRSGTAWSALAAQVGTAGLTTHPQVLRAYGRLAGHAGRIRAGEFLLAPGTTPAQLLQQLVAGRVVLHKFTLVEGWSIQDIVRAVRAQPALDQTLDDARAGELPAGLARQLELAWPSAEGAFLPETYLFARGTTDRELLSRAHQALVEQLDRSWTGRRAGLPIASPYELLVLASIIERETALASERPVIAGVFIRRLQKGMRLQTDPTVIYGLGERFDGNLTRRDLDADSPWNTYTRTGLPPTPIAAPSAAAIEAAANPADGDALFFVATGAGDGSHHFSATLKEHEAAVRDYLATLGRRNRN